MLSRERVRVVLDTNVLVRAHPRSNSKAARLLRTVLAGGHTLLLSNAMIFETSQVLRYPRLQKLYGLGEAEVLDYCHFLQSTAELVLLREPYAVPSLRDAKDLDVMQTAERGGADVLCSSDGDFHEVGIVAYCGVRGIEVCRESDLLERLAGLSC